MAQMGFFDLSDRYASLDAKKDPLVEINAVVKFVPDPGHWGTLPLSMKGAPNGSTATEIYGRL